MDEHLGLDLHDRLPRARRGPARGLARVVLQAPRRRRLGRRRRRTRRRRARARAARRAGRRRRPRAAPRQLAHRRPPTARPRQATSPRAPPRPAANSSALTVADQAPRNAFPGASPRLAGARILLTELVELAGGGSA